MAKRSVPKVVRGTVKYEIVSNNKAFDGKMEVGGRRLKLSRRGNLYTHDPALAHDIDQKYGFDKRGTRRKDVVVCPVPNEDPEREPGHRYLFVMPAMPWHKEK